MGWRQAESEAPIMSYGDPQYPGYGPQPVRPVGSVWDASLKVRWPAIGLASVAGLNVGLCLIMMVASLQVMVPTANRPQRPPGATSSGDPSNEQPRSWGGVFGGVIGGGNLIGTMIGLAISAFFSGMILVGTRKMRNVESYFTAITISIVAIIPGLSPICVAGIPFGIWSLIVLTQRDVRYAFRGRA
jgi:amino acid transporter